MSDPTDCRDCHYAIPVYARLQCLAMNHPKPVEWMRREENECGPSASMFEPKTKNYTAYD